MNLAFLVGKNCHVYQKNKFYRQGKILDADDAGIVIQDRYVGKVLVPMSEIENVREVEENGTNN